MKKTVVSYKGFRFSKLNDPQFSHLKLLLGWVMREKPTAFARRRDGTWVLEGQIYDGSSLTIPAFGVAILRPAM